MPTFKNQEDWLAYLDRRDKLAAEAAQKNKPASSTGDSATGATRVVDARGAARVIDARPVRTLDYNNHRQSGDRR